MTDLHPQMQTLVQMFADAPGPALHEMSPADARTAAEGITAVGGPGPEVAQVEDLEIPGPDGPLKARSYQPTSDTAPAVLLFLHGGGWVVGDLTSHDAVCRTLALAAGVQVVSAEYRLAPEARFPGAVDDAVAALQYVSDKIADGRPLVVAGDSSGGNLAAVVAQHARDNGGPAIAMQVLFYPVTDSDLDTGSYREHADAIPLGAKDMEYFWGHYVADAGQRSDPRASPLQSDLAGLPPAYITTCGHDPLHDEGEAYAEKLKAAGVATEYRPYDDMAHGFLNFLAPLDTAREAVADAGVAIRKTLGLKS